MAAPTKATGLSPAGDTPHRFDQPITFSWTFNDPDSGDAQSRADIRYRPIGAPNWIEADSVTATTQTAIIPAYTFLPTIHYEWQVATYDAASNISPWSDSSTFYTVSPPNAPSPVSPNGIGIDVNSTQRFSWVFSDPDTATGAYGDSQSKADLRYRITGGTTWTQITEEWPNTYMDVEGGTFSANQSYEWQVRTYDSLGYVGPWSSSSFFSARNTPATPTITAPANGATINGTTTLTWSASQQDAYQVRRTMDDNGSADLDNIIYDSGTVEKNYIRSVLFEFGINNRYEHLQVRVRSGGLWSDWADTRFYIQFNPPNTAVLSVIPDNDTATITIQVYNPDPTGGAPAMTHQDLYIVGNAKDPMILKANLPAQATYVYQFPTSGVPYTFYTIVYAANGSSKKSLESGQVQVDLKGVWLMDPSYPEPTKYNFTLNGDGAREEYTIESALVQYEGREFPSAEYGEHTSRIISVQLASRKEDDGEHILRLLTQRRKPVLYRDSWRRKIYGLLSSNPVTDGFDYQIHDIMITELELSDSDFAEPTG